MKEAKSAANVKVIDGYRTPQQGVDAVFSAIEKLLTVVSMNKGVTI